MRMRLLVPLLLPALAAAQPELLLQTGHRGAVPALAFDPGGRFLASGGRDGTVRLWDLESRKLVRALPPSRVRVRGLAFTPDGRHLVIGRINARAELWDVREERRHDVSIPDRGGYCGVCVTPDGRLFATGGDEEMQVREVAGRARVARIVDPDRDRYWDVALSPDGGLLAGASNDKEVNLWSVPDRTLARTLAGHELAVKRVWFLEGGDRLVSVDRGGGLLVWSVEDGRRLAEKALGGPTSTWSVAADCDGRRLAYALGEGRVVVEDLLGDADPAEITVPGEEIVSVALGPDAAHLATGHADGRVRVHRLPSGSPVAVLGGDVATPLAATATPEGTVRVAVRGGGTLAVLDLEPPETVWKRTDAGGGAVVARFAPGGGHLACGVPGGPVDVVDLSTGESRAFAAGGPRIRGALALAPGGARLALRAAPDRVEVWKQGGEEPLQALPGNAVTDILALAFDRAGERLAQGGKGNFIRILDTTTSKPLASRETPGLVTSRSERPGWDRSMGWVRSAAFSPDGRLLLCGGPYGTMVLRRAGDLAAVRPFHGHRSSVVSTAFTPGGRRVLSIGDEGALVVWDTATAAALATVRFLGVTDWVVTTPDGRLDGTPPALARVTRPGRDEAGRPTTTAAPPPTPGLLSRILEDG